MDNFESKSDDESEDCNQDRLTTKVKPVSQPQCAENPQPPRKQKRRHRVISFSRVTLPEEPIEPPIKKCSIGVRTELTKEHINQLMEENRQLHEKLDRFKKTIIKLDSDLKKTRREPSIDEMLDTLKNWLDPMHYELLILMINPGRTTSRRYGKNLLEFAKALRLRSPWAYEYAAKHLPLPSDRTLERQAKSASATAPATELLPHQVKQEPQTEQSEELEQNLTEAAHYVVQHTWHDDHGQEHVSTVVIPAVQP